MCLQLTSCHHTVMCGARFRVATSKADRSHLDMTVVTHVHADTALRSAYSTPREVRKEESEVLNEFIGSKCLRELTNVS